MQKQQLKGQELLFRYNFGKEAKLTREGIRIERPDGSYLVEMSPKRGMSYPLEACTVLFDMTNIPKTYKAMDEVQPKSKVMIVADIMGNLVVVDGIVESEASDHYIVAVLGEFFEDENTKTLEVMGYSTVGLGKRKIAKNVITSLFVIHGNPFRSEAQRRFLWANHPDIARRWESKYGSKVKTMLANAMIYNSINVPIM